MLHVAHERVTSWKTGYMKLELMLLFLLLAVTSLIYYILDTFGRLLVSVVFSELAPFLLTFAYISYAITTAPVSPTSVMYSLGWVKDCCSLC